LPKIQAHLPTREKRVNHRLAKAESLEKKLKSEGGHSKEAKKVASEIKKVQKLQTKVKHRLSRLQAKCSATSGSTTTTTSGSASA
jgi:metal-dependent amidase/aminoacylase/carboxypeptidase family protein